ncbi:MAG: response regulator [Deltaproteobacteria bacterium]|nr:MAG: response regulator [Deltaproteobacteria bacterium]
MAENIGDYLEYQGHITDFAMDGIGWMHLALTREYDAIVLDIMLPGIDGLTFCLKLREEGKHYTPVLMLRHSAAVLQEAGPLCFTAG